MGKTRQGREEPIQEAQKQSLAPLAAALAASVGASQAAGVSSVASALLPFLPASLKVPGALVEELARAVAILLVEDVPQTEDTEGYIRRGRIEQLFYRAAFGRAAFLRLARAVAEASPSNVRLRFENQLRAEKRYFDLHRQTRSKQDEAARRIDEAMQRFGDVLSWNVTFRPSNRPHHRRAHAHNWFPLRGAPITTGGIPGELLHCLCYAGPPRPGAPIVR